MKRVISTACIVVLSFALLSGCTRKPATSPAEAKAYEPNISFSNFRLSAAENMAGTAVYDIQANVANNGNRTIALLGVTAVFHDVDGLVVLKQPAEVVNARRGALGPHQARDFHMRFEGIPESWNRVAPELQITQLELQ